MVAVLTLTEVTVVYGSTVALDGVDLSVDEGEIVAVIGPSGCGKSTLLRTVAGLERPVTGRVAIDGRDVTDHRPDRRGVGLMFQDHALFPHRSVAGNIAFGPRMHGYPADRVRARVEELLTLVRLDGFGQRPVTSLSGGEQQRVALARALAVEPRLLLLDEPLGSLDRRLGEELLTELGRVVRTVGTTVVHVTHDQDEALALADRIVVLRDGRIEQLGRPDELWRSPSSAFVAGFLGLDRLVDAEVTGGRARTAYGTVPTPGVPDGRVQLVLLPDAVRLLGPDRAPRRDDELELTGTVIDRRFAGDHVRLAVALSTGGDLRVPVWRGAGPAPGTTVALALDPTGVHVLPDRAYRRG